MTKTATIQTMPRPRGVLTDVQECNLAILRAEMESVQAEYRAYVVKTLADGASFSEVSKATGLSTNTLQRWKREAGE